MAIELNFTKTAITDLPTPAKGRAVYRDVGGKQSESTLHMYVGKQTSAFYFVKKHLGQKIEYRLGTFPTYPIEKARKKAKKLSSGVDDGIDPRIEKRAERVDGLTLLEVIEQYLAHAQARGKKPIRDSTKDNYERVCKIHFSNEKHEQRDGGKPYKKPARRWYGKSAKKITADMVEAWYSKASKYSVSSSNSAVRCVRAAYNHQLEISRKQQSGEFANNPFSGLELIEERAREDYIEPDQLAAWLSAVEKLPNPVSRDYLKLLLFTGMRRREAAGLRWEQIDMQRRIIQLSAADTKNGEPFQIPLSDYLVELLTGRNQTAESEFVFPGTGKSGHLSEPRKPVETVNKEAGTHTTVHGLRRTYSNVALWQAGIPDIARKKLINHAMPKNDVTAIHYTNLPLDQKRKYQQQVTDKILELAGVDRTALKVRTLEVAR